MAQRNSQRAGQENNTLESVDRISALPDSILGAILSLLPTKDAVATSTLSKRWEFVWRTVHNLDICLYDHRVGQEVVDKNEKFIEFVNHVLLHLDAGVLKEFRLVWRPYCIESHLTSWIEIAIARNVHNISLTLQSYNKPFVMMPISAFSSDSLRSLKLWGRSICILTTTVFSFPRLESLDLHGVALQPHETLEDIIRRCPVLNYLKLDVRDDEEDDDIIISSTSLKRLELQLGSVRRYLKVEASSLEYLKIHNNEYVYMDFVELSSLVEADLSFQMYCHDEYYLEADILDSLGDALSALDCVQILTLCPDLMWVLSFTSISSSTRFKRLVKLDASIYMNWSSLQELIQRSDNLEALTIHQYSASPNDVNENEHSSWTTPEEVPICLSTSLKEVVFHRYNGDDDEREMISYMLKHGSVLEVMEISSHRDKNLLQEILEFPRKSLACEVKFF